MKNILYVLFISLCFACCKKDKTKHYVITASKTDTVNTAYLKIDDKVYPFTSTTIEQPITVEEYGVVSVTAYFNGTPQKALGLDLTENGEYIDNTSGLDYIYMIVSNSSISKSSTSSSSSSSGSNCVSVQCSATTQSGSRCKRKTTNCNGRCWQHQ